MMKRFVAALLVACLAWAPVYSFANNKSPGGAPGLTNAASVSITGGNITGNVTGVPIILGQGGIPVISVSTGSMGNNGALTGITALPRTIANCYMLFPAGAIAAGVPAAATFYFVQMSSSTAGTVFNNTYSGTGVPAIPASPTAFVTTGPGAFTGNTTEVGILITIPANAMKLYGAVRIAAQFGHTNSAGAKTERIRFGGIAGTVETSGAPTTTTGGLADAMVTNQGLATSQIGTGKFIAVGLTSFTTTLGDTVSSVTTSADTTVAITVQPAAATDNAWISQFTVELLTYSL